MTAVYHDYGHCLDCLAGQPCGRVRVECDRCHDLYPVGEVGRIGDEAICIVCASRIWPTAPVNEDVEA